MVYFHDDLIKNGKCQYNNNIINSSGANILVLKMETA